MDLDAEEIGNSIVFLASKKVSGINGEILFFVDGGIDALMNTMTLWNSLTAPRSWTPWLTS